MTRTETERLTRIETLLEADLRVRAEERQGMREKVEGIVSELKSLREEMTTGFTDMRKELGDDKAELAALKNRGVGLLVGAGLAGGAVWEAIRAVVGSVVK